MVFLPFVQSLSDNPALPKSTYLYILMGRTRLLDYKPRADPEDLTIGTN
jgi:hypothetical protein